MSRHHPDGSNSDSPMIQEAESTQPSPESGLENSPMIQEAESTQPSPQSRQDNSPMVIQEAESSQPASESEKDGAHSPDSTVCEVRAQAPYSTSTMNSRSISAQNRRLVTADASFTPKNNPGLATLLICGSSPANVNVDIDGGTSTLSSQQVTNSSLLRTAENFGQLPDSPSRRACVAPGQEFPDSPSRRAEGTAPRIFPDSPSHGLRGAAPGQNFPDSPSRGLRGTAPGQQSPDSPSQRAGAAFGHFPDSPSRRIESGAAGSQVLRSPSPRVVGGGSPAPQVRSPSSPRVVGGGSPAPQVRSPSSPRVRGGSPAPQVRSPSSPRVVGGGSPVAQFRSPSPRIGGGSPVQVRSPSRRIEGADPVPLNLCSPSRRIEGADPVPLNLCSPSRRIEGADAGPLNLRSPSPRIGGAPASQVRSPSPRIGAPTGSKVPSTTPEANPLLINLLVRDPKKEPLPQQNPLLSNMLVTDKSGANREIGDLPPRKRSAVNVNVHNERTASISSSGQNKGSTSQDKSLLTNLHVPDRLGANPVVNFPPSVSSAANVSENIGSCVSKPSSDKPPKAVLPQSNPMLSNMLWPGANRGIGDLPPLTHSAANENVHNERTALTSSSGQNKCSASQDNSLLTNLPVPDRHGAYPNFGNLPSRNNSAANVNIDRNTSSSLSEQQVQNSPMRRKRKSGVPKQVPNSPLRRKRDGETPEQVPDNPKRERDDEASDPEPPFSPTKKMKSPNKKR